MRFARFVALACVLVAPCAASAADKPLSVLFLGDDGHHRPSDRYAQIAPVLESRGIEAAYTKAMSDLNAATLAKYDALVVYSNTTEITKDQEAALLEYVAKGGGFVPLHCASYCFLNSPAYVELVGAQFSKHGTGEFDTKVVDADHPITKGLIPFRTWDETYVHTKHNTKDRHVFQVREDEPWTWTRTHGKGRVFYTAYGHDARTWGHPAFHDLVERGIRWAANKGDVKDSRPKVASGLKPFEYEQADIPSYVPGAKWGTMAEPIKKMQKPLTAEESMKHLAMPGGFKAELFVAEPKIGKPITMTWDHLGRLYVAETADYPNEIQPRGKGRDRISMVEDTDGDGKADKVSVFADNLSIPTSLCYANDGLIVAQAPDMLFLKDTDGDGKADERKVLFTGFSTSDTHAGPSNLRYGLDNWIYAIIGYAGYNGTVGGERHQFRQGFFRFKPDGSKLEFLRSTNNNSWGVGISEEGLLFGSTANGCPSVYMPIANRYYESVRGMAPAVLQNIADSNRFFPVTENVRQVDWHGGFTAGAGSALYTARTYPKEYWNKTAFVAEPTGHLVATFALVPNGTDFSSHNAWNLVASNDEWTAPIAAEVGPDGNVWMIDWYNFIVQHNPTPEGYKTGKGGAYEIPLRDKTHGRIYRIVSKHGKPSERPKLSKDDPEGLVAALTNDNMFWRLHAQRLLVERGGTKVPNSLKSMLRDHSVDETGLNPGVIHALWTMHGIGIITWKNVGPDAVTLLNSVLRHPSAGVRRNAAISAPAGTSMDLLTSGLLIDPDAQVRLATLLRLSVEPVVGSQNGGPVMSFSAERIAKALASGAADGDRWLPDAFIAAGAGDSAPFLSAIATERIDPSAATATATVVARVAEHHARGGSSEGLGAILACLDGADPKVRDAIVAGLAKGWPKDKPPTLDAASTKAIAEILPKLSAESRGQLLGLATRWNMKGLDDYMSGLAKEFLASASDESKPDAARLDAAQQLIDLRKSDGQAARDLLALVKPKSGPELATGLIDAASKSESAEVGPALVDAIGAMAPAARKAAVRALLSKSDWTSSLVEGIEEGKIAMSLLALDQSQALAAHPDAKIAAKAKALLAKGGGLPDPDRQKVIDELSPIVMKGGDVAKGKEVFKAQCLKCHSHSGEGGKVGPDLTGMAAHPRSELIVHILDPSRSVEGNFLQYNVSTNDGRIFNGLLASETKTSVELLDAEGKKQTLLREDIDELVASKKSVMPEGFEKQVPAESIADLLQFLTQRGKYLPLDLRKVATVVSTKGMFFEPEGDIERLIFADWGPKTFEGVPFALVDPQVDRVPNAVLLNGPLGKIPPKMPKSVNLPVNAPAKAIHFLSGVAGWGYPVGREGSVSMIIRLHYADGSTEDHELKNGVHFADYNGNAEVPGSKLAFKLRGQQLRYLAIAPKKQDAIASIDLIKGRDQTAPIVMAVTVEGAE